jgi:alpha-tubulin suppressor-like RCC1 family protein
MNGQVRAKSRAAVIAIALFSLIATGAPFAPVTPVRAAAPTLTVAGQQPNGLGCCGKNAFGDATGRYTYTVAYGGTVKKIDRVTGSNSDTGVQVGPWNYSPDGSKVWLKSSNGGTLTSIDMTTGATANNTITGADWGVAPNPVALAIGTISVSGTPTSVAIVLDAGYAYGINYKAGLYVIDLSTFGVIIKHDWDTVTGVGLQSGFQLPDSYDASLVLSVDGSTLFASNNGVAYEIDTSSFTGSTLAGIGEARVLLRGRTVSTQDLLYNYVAGNPGFVKVYNTATDTMVKEFSATSTPAYSGDPRGLVEAPNGDLYIPENGNGVNAKLVHLSKADSYSETRIDLPENLIMPAGLTYSDYSTDGVCIFINSNSVELLTAVSVDGASCGAFRSARFGSLPTQLAIDGSTTLTIDNNFTSGTDADWVGIGVFLDGNLVETYSPTPSSLTLNWSDLKTGVGFEVRAYNAANLGVVALADVDLDTPYVENKTMLIDFYPLAASQFAAGDGHTCAIVSDSAYCWGQGLDGERGDGVDMSGDVSNQTTPEAVVANDGFTNTNVSTVVTGLSTTCVIEDSVLYCWGQNSYGQLGIDTEDNESLPQKVNSNDGFNNTAVTAVDTYDYTTCAVESGSVYCWGYNYDGQIGDESGENTKVPVKVHDNASEGFVNSGITDIATVASSVCAIKGGSVYCWGSDSDGQLGWEGAGDSDLPIKVLDNASEGFVNSGITEIDGGDAHFCALKSGTIFCWGDGDEGQVGNDSTNSVDLPAQVVANDGFTNTSVTAFGTFDLNSCAVEGGSLYCWGDNDDGQFGISDDDEQQKPVKALDNPDQDFTNSGVTAVGVGYAQVCVVANGGGYCAGDNDDGQLGNGTEDGQDLFGRVFGGSASSGGDNGTPGVTETDSTFYENALPTEVAKLSSVKVLRPASMRTKKIVSKTLGVCLAGKNQVLFLKPGTCRVDVVRKRGNVKLRTLTTSVANKTVAQVGKGNVASMVKKVMFNWKSKTPKGMTNRKWATLKTSVNRTGMVFIVGHTRQGKGVSTSKKFAAARANAVKKKVAKRGLGIVTFGMGGKFPIARGASKVQQMKNERVMIYMIATKRPR